MREDARVPTTFNNSIRAELRAIQGTRESKAKGQRLEALLARVLCSVRGMTLEAQDVESAYETEEIDLYFWNDRARDGLHFLDCPLIVECKLAHVIELGLHTQFVGEVLDVKAEESVMAKGGLLEIAKVKPLVFAPDTQAYYGIGHFVGQAFSVGRAFE